MCLRVSISRDVNVSPLLGGSLEVFTLFIECADDSGAAVLAFHCLVYINNQQPTFPHLCDEFNACIPLRKDDSDLKEQCPGVIGSAVILKHMLESNWSVMPWCACCNLKEHCPGVYV